MLKYMGGIQVYSANGVSVPGDGSTNLVTFSTVQFDDLSLWNPAAPTELSVGALGATHVRIYAHLLVNSPSNAIAVEGEFRIRVLINGLSAINPAMGCGQQIAPAGANGGPHLIQQTLTSQIIPCNPDDYYQLNAQNFTTQALTYNQMTFGLELWG